MLYSGSGHGKNLKKNTLGREKQSLGEENRERVSQCGGGFLPEKTRSRCPNQTPKTKNQQSSIHKKTKGCERKEEVLAQRFDGGRGRNERTGEEFAERSRFQSLNTPAKEEKRKQGEHREGGIARFLSWREGELKKSQGLHKKRKEDIEHQTSRGSGKKRSMQEQGRKKSP